MPSPHETAATLRKLRGYYLETPRHGMFQKHFNRLITPDETGALTHVPVRFTDERETRGVMVIDGAGGGKTSLVARALSRHPAMAAPEGGLPRYINARAPTPVTYKGMGTTLLRKSGYHMTSDSNTAGQVWDKLRSRLSDLGITVLWIDEAHDFFCADRELILRALKALTQGDDALIIILSGTERLRDIIRTDDQLLRRFTVQVLPPVDADTAEDVDNMLQVICAYSRIAGLDDPLEQDLVPRLFHAGRNKFGRCIEGVIDAIEVAVNAGASRLSIDHFADSHFMKEGCSHAENPFVARNWSQINLDPPEVVPELPRRAGRRRRG